jgi:transcriptional regulator with XRE-family HTH domain
VNPLLLGEKIWRIRRERGLTIKELAKTAGLSQSLISQIEKNHVTPSLMSLLKISRALNARMSYFFEEVETDADFVVVPSSERMISFREGTKYGSLYESLARSPRDPEIDPLLVTLRPPSGEGRDFFTHKGREFIYILEGEVELYAGDKRYVLHPGDSAFLDARVPHGGVSVGKRKSKVLSFRYYKED